MKSETEPRGRKRVGFFLTAAALAHTLFGCLLGGLFSGGFFLCRFLGSLFGSQTLSGSFFCFCGFCRGLFGGGFFFCRLLLGCLLLTLQFLGYCIDGRHQRIVTALGFGLYLKLRAAGVQALADAAREGGRKF